MTDSSFHLVSWLILRRADGQVLLARRAGVTHGNGRWGLPGGHAEDTETLAQAAAREGLEEVGVQVSPASLTPLGLVRYVESSGEGPAESRLRGASFFFLAAGWQGEPRPLSECSEVAWFPPHALPPDALPWLPATLPRVLSGEGWLEERVLAGNERT